MCFNKQEEFALSLDYYNKGLELRLLNVNQNHVTIADSYDGIGGVYLNKCEYL
jgi:hypothetical protein